MYGHYLEFDGQDINREVRVETEIGLRFGIDGGEFITY
jgi:hypothetical protein